MKSKLSFILCIAMMFVFLTSCTGNNVNIFTDSSDTSSQDNHTPPSEVTSEGSTDNEETTKKEETTLEENFSDVDNPFIDVSLDGTSNVFASSDTSSYKHFCDLVSSGYTLNELKRCSYAFNNEEFLNYVSNPLISTGKYDLMYDAKLADCSWNKKNLLLKITLGMGECEYASISNIVFYIDVSESMGGNNMLPLINKAAVHFAKAVDADDTVSIFTSADEDNILLDSVPGSSTKEIIAALEGLKTQGVANNHAGLEDAFKKAVENSSPDKMSRVVIISDGDISEKYVSVAEKYASDGISVVCLGLGSGNYKNDILKKLANAGNGEYYYVDGIVRAKQTLGKDVFKNTEYFASNLSSTVTFNSKFVSKYRLIGYEGDDGTASGGDSYADEEKIPLGDRITLCYELVLTKSKMSADDVIASVAVNYKKCENDTDNLQSNAFDITYSCYDEDDDEMKLISCTVELLMILKDSPYAKDIKIGDVYNKMLSVDTSICHAAEELTRALGLISGNIKK